MWDWITRLKELSQSGMPCVVATVTRTSGSAPCCPGARLILAFDGRQWGTVGGGALEASVLEHAQAALAKGSIEMLRLPLAAEGQCCGGLVEVLVESMFSGPRVHLMGGGHVAQELSRLLSGTRFQTHLVDERPEWAGKAQGVPGVVCHTVPPRDYIKTLPADSREFVLVLTHSHELDLELLRLLIPMEQVWIGLIGSRNKWRTFRETLLGEGLSGALVDRVCCPVGDTRTGKSPREVGIAMAAQLLVEEARLAENRLAETAR